MVRIKESSVKMAANVVKITLIVSLAGFSMMAKADDARKQVENSTTEDRKYSPTKRLRETPKFAANSNILHNLTSSMNLGLEAGLGQKTTLSMSITLNPWTYNREENVKSKFLLAQPELRYWTCEAFDGHFFGLHAH